MNAVAQKAACLLDAMGIDSVPVPVEPLLQEANADVLMYDFETDDWGMTKRGRHRSFVIIQKGLDTGMERRVIAHECAHLLLHRGNHQYMAGNPLQQPLVRKQDLQAETFAAYYLIPEPALEEYIHTDLMHELADRFCVPMDLMLFRLRLKYQEQMEKQLAEIARMHQSDKHHVTDIDPAERPG